MPKRRQVIQQVESAKDAPLNVRVDPRKKAALVRWCATNYRTPSSLVQQWLDAFLDKEGLELPDLDDAVAVLKGGRPR